jgi:hypothetical protein
VKIIQIIKSAPGSYILLDDEGMLWRATTPHTGSFSYDDTRLEITLLKVLLK